MARSVPGLKDGAAALRHATYWLGQWVPAPPAHDGCFCTGASIPQCDLYSEIKHTVVKCKCCAPNRVPLQSLRMRPIMSGMLAHVLIERE